MYFGVPVLIAGVHSSEFRVLDAMVTWNFHRVSNALLWFLPCLTNSKDELWMAIRVRFKRSLCCRGNV